MFMEFRSLSRLPTYNDEGELHVVVESPRGASVKLKFDEQLGVITVSRALPLGLTYPFDWGFIPGTKAADGDPLDALALHDSSTYPGVILPCRAVGVVQVVQRDENGRKQRNDRVIAMPLWSDRLGEFEKVAQIPKRLRLELEQFFLNTTFFTSKDPKILGWGGRASAKKAIDAARARQS